MTNTLALGDILTRPKAFGFIKHFGVFMGSNSVLHNTREKGEHVSTLDEFSGGEKVTARRTGAYQFGAMARARDILANPKGYHPFNRNCEHTVNEVVHGKAVSLQLVIAGIIAALVIPFLLLRRN